MSIQDRAIQYGTIFTGWKIRQFLGNGSEGKTGVFKITRSQAEMQEVGAVKVVNIFEENGNWDLLSDMQKQDCIEHVKSLQEAAVREVKIMDKLKDEPHIVRFFDFSLTDRWDEAYSFGWDLLIRMELLESLRELLQQTSYTVTEQEIIKIGKDICHALIACHRENIIHRDIKPENIFRNQQGMYKLGDFGISKIVEKGDIASTSAGTNAFCAPEQFYGKPYNKLVDIYSLGLTLYTLSNHNFLPFTTSNYVSAAEIQKRLNSPILPKPAFASNDLSEIIMKACSHEPNKRYQSASEFLKALEDIEGKKIGNSAFSTGKGCEETISFETMPAMNNTTVSLETTTEAHFISKSVENKVLISKEDDQSMLTINDLFQLTKSYIEMNDFEKAEEYYNKFVDRAPNDDSHYILKYEIYKGKGYPLEDLISILEEYKSVEYTPQWMYELAMLYYQKGDKGKCEENCNTLTSLFREGLYVAKALKLKQSFTTLTPVQQEIYDKEEVKLWKEAAEQKDPFAQVHLGFCYHIGDGVQQDYEQAVKWWKEAAEQKDPLAQHALGLCYYFGDGVQQDYKKAVEWWIKAAEQNHAEAQYRLGLCYNRGHGVQQDYEQAVKWWIKAAEQNHAEAQYTVGCCYYYGLIIQQDYKKAVEWWMKAAEQNHAEAQYYLGYCYYHCGLAVQQDYEKAMEWWIKAAEQNDAEAQYTVGCCYYYGTGVQQDYAKAVEWWMKAAEQNHAEAKYAIINGPRSKP